MTILPAGLSVGLLLEALVCVLLAATIGYCAMLDRRLRAMRSGQDGLRDLIRDLSGTTEQALAAIGRLKEASDVTGQTLGEQVKRARALGDELALMIEAGNDIADRLGNLDMRRPAPPPVAASPVMPASGPRAAVPQAMREAKPARETKKMRETHPLLDALKRAR